MDVTVKGVLNNTPDEVRVWLEQAIGICETFYANDDVPEAVLVKVLELLANKTILTMAPQPMPIDLAALRAGPPIGGRH